MREREFRDWLETLGLKPRTVGARMRAVKRIARVEEVNVDEQFQNDGLVSLIQLYSYSAQDERDNRPNPTNMYNDAGNLRDVLAWYKTHLNQYRKFCLINKDDSSYETQDTDGDEYVDVTDTEETETEIVDTGGATFALEADLQNIIRETITQLEAGLEIIDNGVERNVATGFIDILAKDSQGRQVIIELKAGAAQNSVIAQTLGYMVDIADAEGLEINQVRGIIVAGSFGKRIETAARAIPNLTLKTYRYNFEFN